MVDRICQKGYNLSIELILCPFFVCLISKGERVKYRHNYLQESGQADSIQKER